MELDLLAAAWQDGAGGSYGWWWAPGWLCQGLSQENISSTPCLPQHQHGRWGRGSGCLLMTQTSAPLQRSLPRSAAYAPERDLAPATGIPSAFYPLSILTTPAPPQEGDGNLLVSSPFLFGTESGWFGWLLGASSCPIAHPVPSVSSLQLIWPQEPSGPGTSGAFKPCSRQDLRCWMLWRMSIPQ